MKKKHNETLRFKNTKVHIDPNQIWKKTQWNTKVQKDPNRIWKKNTMKH